MESKWAVLEVLAKWPDRRVSFAELRRDVGKILETGTQAEQDCFSGLGDIGAFISGYGNDAMNSTKARQITLAVCGLAIGFCGTWALAGMDRAKLDGEVRRVETLRPSIVEGRPPQAGQAEPFLPSHRTPNYLDI